MNLIYAKWHQNKGFSLIEIVLALLVASVGLIAVTGLVSTGLKYGRNSEDDTIISNFAQDLLENCRNVALVDWNSVGAGMILAGLPSDELLPAEIDEFIADGRIYSVDYYGNTLNYRLTLTEVAEGQIELLLGIYSGILVAEDVDATQRTAGFEQGARWFYTTVIHFDGV